MPIDDQDFDSPEMFQEEPDLDSKNYCVACVVGTAITESFVFISPLTGENFHHLLFSDTRVDESEVLFLRSNHFNDDQDFCNLKCGDFVGFHLRDNNIDYCERITFFSAVDALGLSKLVEELLCSTSFKIAADNVSTSKNSSGDPKHFLECHLEKCVPDESLIDHSRELVNSTCPTCGETNDNEILDSSFPEELNDNGWEDCSELIKCKNCGGEHWCNGHWDGIIVEMYN
jgi:hypothetical protein